MEKSSTYSDWTEHVRSALSTFHKHQTPMLQSSMKDNYKCAVVNLHFKQSNPKLYESITEFAKANSLWIFREDVD